MNNLRRCSCPGCLCTSEGKRLERARQGVNWEVIITHEYYMLDETGQVIQTDNVLEWGRWFEGGHRILKQDTLSGGVLVSTVFLGLDHNFMGAGDPVLWETMVFNGRYDQYQERYSSQEAALRGHARIKALAKETWFIHWLRKLKIFAH